MQAKARNQPQQLIDEHKLFTRQAIDSVVSHIPNVQKEYFSIAIIGVQNSGKSTLLNALFGTNFDVLHEISGTRTTRGILVSLDKNQNFLVMDVEGNDAMDRSEEQDYEKMVATFALVSADVLLINIWSKSLGQYTGSQYETLTTILDICIAQFKQESPKTILFCVRDFNEEVDEEGQIRRKIIKDVNNIWIKAEKPAQYQKYQTTPEKFFTVQVAVLRKYKQKSPSAFLSDVQSLRKRFTNQKDDGYIFKNKKTQFNLPIKDLSQLMQNSWQSIKSNKKLNLPNEKQQLSNFRCSQILNQASSKFRNQIQQISKANKPTNLGQVFQRYSKKFELDTYNYGRSIVQAKQNELKQQMNGQIQKTLYSIVYSEQKRIKTEFRNLSSCVNQDNSLVLEDKLNQIKNQTIDQFSQVFKKFNFEVSDRKEIIQKLASELEKQNIQIKNRIIENLKAEFEKQYSRTMRLMSSKLLKQYFGKDFWVNSGNSYLQKRNQLIKVFDQKIKWAEGRSLEAAQIDQIDYKMSTQLRRSIKQELQKSLINRVFELFLRRFTKSEDGTPYNFNVLEQVKIGELYDQSRDEAREIVALINKYNVQRSRTSSIIQMQEEEDSFFESTWLSNACNQLDRKMIHQYETIIRRKKQDKMKRVPIWLFVVIFYFVYDDVWFSAVEYPILNFVFTVFLIFTAFFFAIGQQNAFIQLFNHFLDLINNSIGKARGKIGF